jgi:NAD(P)H-hydrate epimerase
MQGNESKFWENNRCIQPFLETGVIEPDRMRVIDANARALGVSDLQLMEGAGHALAGVVRRFYPSRVLILCGSGNNGGDGVATARILSQEADVTVCYYSGTRSTPAFIHQLKALEHSSVRIRRFRCRDEILAQSELFSATDLIVDALLGTGASGALREPFCTCVRLSNESKKPIISADIPTPGIIPAVICAFHRAKTENSEVFSIGIPVLAEVCTGPGDLLLVPDRNSNAHKGDGGRILVIGGGPYQGAPYLAGMAALRSGADIVRIATPVPLQFPDLIHEPVHGRCISGDDAEHLCSLSRSADVVVCGMGLGDRSHQVVTTLADESRKAVFDADALRLPLPVAEETIYTPHAGEYTRITGREPGAGVLERAQSLIHEGIPGVTLLKGPVDIVSDGSRVRFNRTGSPAMTTGGTGDILAGVCGGLLTRLPAFDAACIAAYVTGRAGEIVAEKTGYGMAAQDLLSVIPQILYTRIDEVA